MTYKKILTIQDISCMGQCSLTCALPILSVCGLETVILPSAVLSNHTADEFGGFTFRDLTDDIPGICERWKKLGVNFYGIYTGYLGSIKQIELVKAIFRDLTAPGGVKITDPAMADNGKMYKGFDRDFALSMRGLIEKADIIIPNITEACFLTDTPYREKYDEEYIGKLISNLRKITSAGIILTGICRDKTHTGVAVTDGSETKYYFHRKVEKHFHGTGDVYASAFTGAYLQGKGLYDSAVIAADFTLRCIKATKDDPDHWYGVEFEKELPWLAKKL